MRLLRLKVFCVELAERTDVSMGVAPGVGLAPSPSAPFWALLSGKDLANSVVLIRFAEELIRLMGELTKDYGQVVKLSVPARVFEGPNLQSWITHAHLLLQLGR